MLSIGPGNAEYVLVSVGQRRIDKKKHRAMKQGVIWNSFPTANTRGHGECASNEGRGDEEAIIYRVKPRCRLLWHVN